MSPHRVEIPQFRYPPQNGPIRDLFLYLDVLNNKAECKKIDTCIKVTFFSTVKPDVPYSRQSASVTTAIDTVKKTMPRYFQNHRNSELAVLKVHQAYMNFYKNHLSSRGGRTSATARAARISARTTQGRASVTTSTSTDHAPDSTCSSSERSSSSSATDISYASQAQPQLKRKRRRLQPSESDDAVLKARPTKRKRPQQARLLNPVRRAQHLAPAPPTTTVTSRPENSSSTASPVEPTDIPIPILNTQTIITIAPSNPPTIPTQAQAAVGINHRAYSHTFSFQSPLSLPHQSLPQYIEAHYPQFSRLLPAAIQSGYGDNPSLINLFSALPPCFRNAGLQCLVERASDVGATEVEMVGVIAAITAFFRGRS
ncbi:hypothetical protein BJ165DRAFT_1535494 [Panaeolus papilionaceus]|nr:hypothetical protein BJ165DRAFT_1535494 [Panaeolus papilionaceus]